MEQEQQEFYVTLAIYGGLIFAGLLVSIVLGAFAFILLGRNNTDKAIKKLYEKERKNGTGGSHGKY